MHDLSWKYSSVCVHDSQKNYPGLFHLSKDESSECGDFTKQVSVSTDDSATSIWRPNRNNLTNINPVLVQISRSVSDSPSQDCND